MSKAIWVDCDPGHDDVTALLLAIHVPQVQLLGVSTVNGNASADYTFKNACRCLHAFAAPETIRVYSGAAQPLLRANRHDPEIHGPDGLGGVKGLPDFADERVQARCGSADSRAVEQIANAIRTSWDYGKGRTVSIIACGPLTNVALFLCVYIDLIPGIEEIVFMGGGVGTGNRSAVAEFNILCDPEAAQIVLNVPVKKTMIPLNVTHTAIVTEEVLRELYPQSVNETLANTPKQGYTQLRRMLYSLLTFFSSAYKTTFGFNEGPPLHDALTVAYVAYPDMFKTKRYRVDVELSGAHTAGETVVDLWNYQACDDSWGVNGRNCLVAEAVDVNAFFKTFLEAVRRCDKISPLNAPLG